MIYRFSDGLYRFWREIRGIGRSEVYRSPADLKPIGAAATVPAVDADVAQWCVQHPEKPVLEILDEEVAA